MRVRLVKKSVSSILSKMSRECDYQPVSVNDIDSDTIALDFVAAPISSHEFAVGTKSTGFKSYLECHTGRACVVWTIPLIALSVALWILTSLVIVHINNNGAPSHWIAALVSVLIASVVATLVAVLPFFEWIRYNMMVRGMKRDLDKV